MRKLDKAKQITSKMYKAILSEKAPDEIARECARIAIEELVDSRPIEPKSYRLPTRYWVEVRNTIKHVKLIKDVPKSKD